MFDFLNRSIEFHGVALFSQETPPREEIERSLMEAGALFTPSESGTDSRKWSLTLRHPEWGSAELVSDPDVRLPPNDFLNLSPGLTPREREMAGTARSMVSLARPSSEENVLTDRKLSFRYLRAVLGRTGLAALDEVSSLLWSPEGLDLELLHSGDPDIEALYTIHLVRQDEGSEKLWLHTHGLGAVGAFDFDVLAPSEGVYQHGADLLRAMAFSIVEGRAERDDARFDLAYPGGEVRLVPVEEFNRSADRYWVEKLRDPDDEIHNLERSILCEPTDLGPPVPSRFLSAEIPDEIVIHFSNQASDLMAARARATYQLLRHLREELVELHPTTLVKIGYPTDTGEVGSREHLWFEVHELGDQTVDGTCINQPFDVKAVAEGKRGEHPLEWLSDWILFTPVGRVVPRSSLVARLIRERKDEILEAIRSAD